MGLLKRELHQFEELYLVDPFETLDLATAHLHGLCLKCGEPFNKSLRAQIFCPDCEKWARS